MLVLDCPTSVILAYSSAIMTAAASGNNKLDEMREAEELPSTPME
jgi:hypothetical protein